MKTLSQVKQDSAIILEDPELVIFNDDALGLQVGSGLNELSMVRPYEKKESRFLSASSTEIDVSEVVNLKDIPYAEYKVDQSSKQLRNISQFGDTIDIKTSLTPSADDECYLYCEKYHTLVDPPSTLTGAVNNASNYSEGDTSIILDGLGTGIIMAGTLVYFTDIAGEYKVTTDATIKENAATIVITPGLLEDMDDDTVVTFKYSTLSPQMESVLSEYIASKAAMNWTGDGRTQIKSAIDAVALVNSSVDSMAARLTQSIADLVLGRAKILTLLSETAAALTDAESTATTALETLSSGKDSVGDIDISTELTGVDTEMTLALSDIADIRTLFDTAISSFTDELTSVGTEIGLAITDLAAGRALNNKITVNSSAETNRYNAAVGGLNAASARINQIQSMLDQKTGISESGALATHELNLIAGYLQKARTMISAYANAAGQYSGIGARELSALNSYIAEARALISKNANAVNAYVNTASSEVKIANGHLSQAGGYAREVNSRLTVANVISAYQRWGQNLYQIVLSELRGLQKSRTFHTYPEV